MGNKLIWERDGRDWPNRQVSRFVRAAGLRWHVQQQGSGPVLLLVHGTGAATHSWRGVLPLLAKHFTVIAPDLPGSGFTDAPPPRCLSLPGISAALNALLLTLDASPVLAVGHSAGAAILIRMTLDGQIAPDALVSLNGALLPLRGVSGRLFSPAAKLLACSSVAPRLFAWRASDRLVVERLLLDTGSRLEPAGVELYGRLARSSGHVAAALGMMARWDLRPIERELPGLKTPLILVTGDNDRTIPPAVAARARRLLPTATVVRLPGLGHLAHEEKPGEIAELITRLARSIDVLPASSTR